MAAVGAATGTAVGAAVGAAVAVALGWGVGVGEAVDVTNATCEEELGDELSLANSLNPTSATITNTRREITTGVPNRFHELTSPERFGVVPAMRAVWRRRVVPFETY